MLFIITSAVAGGRFMSQKKAKQLRAVAKATHALCPADLKKEVSFQAFYKELKRMSNAARKSDKRIP